MDGPHTCVLYYLLLRYAPNGSVSADTDSISGEWSFTYDASNPLASSTCTWNCPGKIKRYGAGSAHLDDTPLVLVSVCGRFLPATYATSRLRTRQYDLATLREQMRHKDQQSIEHYIDYLKNEELIASGKVDTGWDA